MSIWQVLDPARWRRGGAKRRHERRREWTKWAVTV